MLRGERVVLRSMEQEDFRQWHQLLNRQVELVSLGYGPWQPVSLAQVERGFEKRLEATDNSWFAIEVDGKLIGNIGLKYWSWNRLTGVSECGMPILEPDYLGKGYGREALNLLLEWAFVEQNWRRIWLEVLATNERAIRSYEACGFVEEGLLRQHDYYGGEYVDVMIMGLLRSDWSTRRTSHLT